MERTSQSMDKVYQNIIEGKEKEYGIKEEFIEEDDNVEEKISDEKEKSTNITNIYIKDSVINRSDFGGKKEDDE